MFSRFIRIIGTAVTGGFAIASITAPVAARADDQDPGVARISFLSGGVSVQRADSGDTTSAVVNAPLNAGDYLTTRDDARSELQLDNRTQLRVAPDTQLRFTTMNANSNVLQLAQGTVELRLFHGNEANPEVDTPNASIVPTASGAYRVSVGNDGNAVVTVRSGAATISTQNTSQTFTAGTSVEIDGDARGARLNPIDVLANDDFDAYNIDRDRYETNAPSYAYVDDRIVGAGDLDQYGSWQDVDGYGEVWHPHYAAGWAPYQDGNWTWEPFYGWTWVSAEPWGWAPYHYGRWFYASNGGGWCWTPATRYVQPIYQPAQVAFFSFGFGNGGGISIGFGNVGWVPLGPTDPFRPWWGRGYDNGYGGNQTIVNVTNITNVTNIYNYHNINAPGGIVAIRNSNFQNGEFGQRLHVTAAALRSANIATVRGVLPLVPTARNLAFKANETVAQRAELSPRFAHFKPVSDPVATRSFAEQRAAVSAVAQRAYPTEAQSFARQSPATRSAGTASSPRTGETIRATVREPNRPTDSISTPTRANTGDDGLAPRELPNKQPPSVGQPVTARQALPVQQPATVQQATTNQQSKAASPWDRFSKQNSAGGPTPQVTNVRGGSAERTVTEAPESGSTRPSYARPGPADLSRPTALKAAVPQMQSVAPQRSAAASPWARFGAGSEPNTNARTAAPVNSAGRVNDPNVGVYRASRPSPSLNPAGANGSASRSVPVDNPETAPARRYATTPSGALTTQRAQSYPAQVRRSGSPERPIPTERITPDRQAAPVERTTPIQRDRVERVAPVERNVTPDRSARVERNAAPAPHRNEPAAHAGSADQHPDAGRRDHR